jgi:dihydroflavonol-4-reductase
MNETVFAVTGISGLVGGNLARTLLAQGYRVRGLIHHDRRAIQGLDVECFPGDVREIDSLRRIFSGAEVVYHLAAHISLEMSEGIQAQAVNVLGTRNVVTACLECGVERLVHVSSIYAVDPDRLDLPENESSTQARMSSRLHYSHSKTGGELEVRRGMATGLDAVILRPTGIIGPYDFKPSYLGKAILALAHRKIPALVRGGFDWVDVRDVVDGMIQAQHKAPSGSSYILSGHWRSVRAIADQVTLLTGVPVPRIIVPLWMAYLGIPLMKFLAKIHKQEPLYTRVSLDALGSIRLISGDPARRELNISPRPFEETIADAVNWFAANGYLQLPGN